MTPNKTEIASIYDGIENIPGIKPNMVTWNSETPIFREVLHLTQPRVVVEVGSFLGGSVINMAKICAEKNLDTLFYSVDTFHGQVTDGIEDMPESQLPQPWKTVTRYQQFLFNIKHAGFHDRVIPVVNFSAHGAKMLMKWSVVADVVYVDGDHSDYGCSCDIHNYWPLLKPNGIMFFDDFTNGGVMCAVSRFARDNELPIEIVGGQAYLRRMK